MPKTLAKLYRGGEFKIKNEIYERMPLLSEKNRIEIRATGLNATDASNRYIKINGTTILTQGRGVGLVRLNEFGDFVDANTYDTYASDDAAKALSKIIRTTPDGYTMIFATYDEPSNKMAFFKDTLASLGFNKLDWNYRCAWLGVCYKGGQVLTEKIAYGAYAKSFCEDSIEIPKGVIYYPFDRSIISYNGIQGGNSKLLFSYRENKLFNGTSDYIEIGALNLDFSQGFYIKFKARWDALQNWSRIFDFGNGSGVQNILISNYGTTNTLSFNVYVSGADTFINISNAITIGSIDEFIISVAQDKTTKIYKNGTQIYSGALNALPENVERTNCYIGKSNWTADSLFNGYIEYIEFREGPYDFAYDGTSIMFNDKDSGLCLQTPTTNLIDTQGGNASTDWSKWSHWNNTVYFYTSEQYYDPIYNNIFKGKAKDTTFIYDYYPYSVTANTKYSFSCYIKTSKPVTKSITGYITRSSDNTTIGSETKTYSFNDEWTYVEFQITPSETTTCGIRISFGSGWDGIYIYVAKPMLEQSKFSSQYISNSTSSTSKFAINFPVLNEFTIFYKYSPNEKWATYFPETSYMNKEKWYLYDRNVSKKVWWFEYVNGSYGSTTSSPWIGFDEYVNNTYTPWHWHFGNYNITKKNEYWFALTKSGANWSVYYIDDLGYKKATAVHTNQDLINFIPKSILFVGNFNWILKEFFIYNKALSEQEILKLTKYKMSFMQSGNIISYKTVEKINSMPADVYYFPLSNEVCDITKSYYASEEQNIVYEDGAAFVGKNYSNLFLNGSFELDSNSDGVPDNFSILNASNSTCSCSISYDGIDGGKCVRLYKGDWTNQTDDKYSALIQTINASASTTYTLSCSYKLILNSALTDAPRTVGFVVYFKDLSDAKISYLTYWTFEETDNWKTKSFTFTTPANTAKVEIQLRISCNGYWFIDNVSLRQAPFLLPYSISGDGSLEFNLNNSLALDWSGDWSLVYFKKPVGTHSGMVGFNLESLGCNSNSVGGSYIWWGKNNNSNSLWTSGSGGIGTKTDFSCTFSDINNQYFNQWSMVSVIKNGTTITIKEWLKNGIYSASYSGTTLTANGFVTQHGYDLKLGGWDNSNPVNSYYRDLIIAKRALTDAELDSIYRTLIRQKKGIQTQHNLIEAAI